MKLRELIEAYRTDRRSQFPCVAFATPTNYERMVRHVETDMGAYDLTAMDEVDLLRHYSRWRFPEGMTGTDRLAWSHCLVTTLRLVFEFGLARGDVDCRRLHEAAMAIRFRGRFKTNQRAA